MLVLNATLGVVQGYRAETALAELKLLASPLSRALRDGVLVRIRSDELVPGDRAAHRHFGDQGRELAIVDALKARGEVVAVTGDG